MAPSVSSQSGSPFSSWGNSIKKAARRFGRGPLSRAAKEKDAVDDLLNSEAFLNKKVEMLQKQIRVTQEDTQKVEEEAEKQWEEWGPQVSQTTRRFDAVVPCDPPPALSPHISRRGLPHIFRLVPRLSAGYARHTAAFLFFVSLRWATGICFVQLNIFCDGFAHRCR